MMHQLICGKIPYFVELLWQMDEVGGELWWYGDGEFLGEIPRQTLNDWGCFD